MKRVCSIEHQLRDPKSIRLSSCGDELGDDGYGAQVALYSHQETSELALSDDTEVRDYSTGICEDILEAPCEVIYAEDSPADRSAVNSSLALSPTPSPTPTTPSADSRGILDDDLAPSLPPRSSSTGAEPTRFACKRVRFAPGPLDHASDGHPEVSQVVIRSTTSSFTSIACFPTEALTRHNLAAMEDELGEDFSRENAASLVRLKRRLGIIPMKPIPRPYATVHKARPNAR